MEWSLHGRGEDGQWYRDEMVEFDSDEEPQCVDGKVIVGSGALSSDDKTGGGNSSATTNEVPSVVGANTPSMNTPTYASLVFYKHEMHVHFQVQVHHRSCWPEAPHGK